MLTLAEWPVTRQNYHVTVSQLPDCACRIFGGRPVNVCSPPIVQGLIDHGTPIPKDPNKNRCRW